MSELFGSELEALRAAVADHNRELAAMASWQQRMRARVEKAEATIARVKDLADRCDNETPDSWGVTYVYISRLRKELEGAE